MKLSSSDQQSIVSLLTRFCHEIAPVENTHGLKVGGGDFRPRIEYFHDAVRAFSSGDASARNDGGRLSVEALAYDVVTLRQLQSKPLTQIHPHAHGLSPQTDLMQVAPGSIAPTSAKPDRAVREQLGELYQNYAVLFSALLRPIAEQDYQERTDELNEEVEEVDQLIAELQKLRGGKGRVDTLANLAAHLASDELRILVTTFIQKGTYKRKEDIDKLIAYLKVRVDQDDKDVKTLDDSHKNYVMSQLALYEASRDMLKKMASSGMNLVGNFVQNALRDNQQGRGR
jgi:hypothetical protein